MPWIPSGSAATMPSSSQRTTAPSPSPYKPSRTGSKQLQSGSNWLILDLMSTLIQWSCGTLCHTVVQARLVFSFTKLYKQSQQKCSQNAAKKLRICFQNDPEMLPVLSCALLSERTKLDILVTQSPKCLRQKGITKPVLVCVHCCQMLIWTGAIVLFIYGLSAQLPICS